MPTFYAHGIGRDKCFRSCIKHFPEKFKTAFKKLGR